MKYLLLVVLFALPCFAHEAIEAPTDQKTQYCQEFLRDQIVIAQYASNGAPQDKLEALARRARDIDDARRENIINLIREAYQSGDATEWLNGYWLKCLGGEI